MNEPEVARFWKMPWPRERIASYLRQQDRSTHSTPYLGELDGVPMSYWELYRADLDPLARHYAARDHDAGLHMLLGPAECRGRGLAVGLLRAVSTWQLDADPRATRVVGEPDVDNVRTIRVAELAGFRRITDIDLPDKRAALMVRDRAAIGLLEPHRARRSVVLHPASKATQLMLAFAARLCGCRGDGKSTFLLGCARAGRNV
jgi:RimJ/RimL family protein N-acetyltransferase